MSVEGVTPEDFMGGVTGSICQRRGRIESMDEQAEYKVAFAGSGTGGSGSTSSTAGAVRASVPGSLSARELFDRASMHR
jgi:translation elongation factor EF-G